MRVLRSFVIFLFIGAGAASAGPWPLPSPLPALSPDVSAVTPVPRLDWLQHVWDNFARARKMKGAVDFVLDGDSITDFWQGEGREVFTKHFGKLRSIDFAIAGDRTEHVLWRLSQGQVDGLSPKLIALMVGTNNLGFNDDEQIAKGVAAVVQAYRQLCPRAVILLQGIFPRGADSKDPNRKRVSALNSSIKKLADGKHVIYLDFGKKFLGPDGSLSPKIMPDFLHPSAEGYEIWARAIQPIVDRYVPAR